MKEKKILSQIRLERAKEFLEEANLFLKANKLRGSVNRSYYAVFSAMRSLLILEGASAKTHEGVKTLFNLRFIRTKRLPARFSESIESLYKSRLDADYSDFVYINRKQARKFFSNAKSIIKHIEKLQKKLLKES